MGQVTKKNETVIMRRGEGEGGDEGALVPASELTGLEETEYLLSSTRNAKRLLSSLAPARRIEGTEKTVNELADELGLGGSDA